MNTKPNIKSLLILALVVLLSSNSNIAQNVGIGAESFTPDPSAGLEVKFSDKGFLPPRMTTEQRDEIHNPATGLLVFNTTTNCVEVFIPPIWQSMYCGCTSPNSPTSGTHTPSTTQIIWNWNAVTGADGYKYNTNNDYATASDNGTSTTYTQEGLDCETEYTLYVWAYNACGNSTALTLTQTTSACPICDVPSVTFTYKGQQVTYNTVESNGKCWLDRNLGATAVATSSTHAASYGDLFQWGRGDDGHQNRSITSVSGQSSLTTPTGGQAGKFLHDFSNWYTGSNPDALWQGVSGTNNPCPSGWRVPTEAEWNAERLSWAPNNNSTGAINSPLKLPLAGYRDTSDGALYSVGSNGHYWSGSVVGTLSRYLAFHSGNAVMGSHHRAHGLSVRCIKD